MLAAKAKYPSVLARSARLQIFATKKHRILQLQIFRTKNVFFETKNVVFLQLHENGHFHGATFISDDLSVHYDSYILAHTVIGP